MHSKDELREIAMTNLVRVAKNPKAPAAAVAGASRTILEAIGDIGRLQEATRASEKPLYVMNADEIDGEIARLRPKT